MRDGGGLAHESFDPRSCYLVLGPTAVGKSDIAVAIAERCGGEIVSADAFQVYNGLDILTAKPSANLRGRVTHHLIGKVPLSQSYDVGQWLASARARIAEIHSRGRVAIVVGGTGLYVRALTKGLADLPKASPELRAELELLPLVELQARFVRLDPEGASRIDLQNPRRLIRALEVCLLTGKPFSKFRTQWNEPRHAWKGIVLTRDRVELYSRIDQRTEAMFAAGVIEEVAASAEIGATANQILGLREIRSHLAGALTRQQCIAAIQQATRNYAKRQMTWFRRESEMLEVRLTPDTDLEVFADDFSKRVVE